MNKNFKKEEFKKSVAENVKTLYRKTIDEATPQQVFQAVSYTVKDVIKMCIRDSYKILQTWVPAV